MTNATVKQIAQALEKINTGDLAPDGVLDRDFADEFIVDAIADAPLLDMVSQDPVDQDKTSIRRLGIGRHTRRSQAEGAEGARANITTDRIDILCKKSAVYWDLTREDIENNPEGENLAGKIMNGIQRRWALDTQEIAIRGDEDMSNGDADDVDFYRQNDGFLKVAMDEGMPQYSHTDTSDNELAFGYDLLSMMKSRYPDEYEDSTDPVLMVNPDQVDFWRRVLVDQYDDAGFDVMNGQRDLTPLGMQLVPLKFWPEDKVMMTEPQNLRYAYSRELEMDSVDSTDDTLGKDLFAKYALRVKDDFAIENPDAGLLATDIAAPAPPSPSA